MALIKRVSKRDPHAICKCDKCGKEFKIYDDMPGLEGNERFELCGNCYHDNMMAYYKKNFGTINKKGNDKKETEDRA